MSWRSGLAVTPRDNEAFFREVDEELRRDRMQSFLARYGKLVAVAIILFLAAVGGFLWWQHQRQVQAERQAERFGLALDDLEDGKTSALNAPLDKLTVEGNDAYRTQALLLKAGLAAQAGKSAEAIGLYRRIASDEDAPQTFRDAALIRQTALEYDKLEPAAVITRLKPLAIKGNPWFGSAGEMVGIAYLRQGKAQQAAPIFVALAKDEKMPETLRLRANEIATSLGIDTGLQDGAGKANAMKEASR